MRTPGGDFDCGRLPVHRRADRPADVQRVAYCDDVDDETQRYNVVTVDLQRPFDAESVRRNFYATSSCGVCGKAAWMTSRCGTTPVATGTRVDAEVLVALPDRLREKQRVFDRTGGLHAAGLFDVGAGSSRCARTSGGTTRSTRWSGEQLLAGASRSRPRAAGERARQLRDVQKAAVAGMPGVAAVSAPSSLAVEAAERRHDAGGLPPRRGLQRYSRPGADRPRSSRSSLSRPGRTGGRPDRRTPGSRCPSLPSSSGFAPRAAAPLSLGGVDVLHPDVEVLLLLDAPCSGHPRWGDPGVGALERQFAPPLVAADDDPGAVAVVLVDPHGEQLGVERGELPADRVSPGRSSPAGRSLVVTSAQLAHDVREQRPQDSHPVPTPPVEPGRLTIRGRRRVPATPRESTEVGTARLAPAADRPRRCRVPPRPSPGGSSPASVCRREGRCPRSSPRRRSRRPRRSPEGAARGGPVWQHVRGVER